jgi:two-component system response regulator NreC
VVVLTMQEDPEFARHALRAGATGYVLKEAADSELVEAVRRAAVGETYLNPRLGAALAAAPPAESGTPDDRPSASSRCCA